MNLAVAQMGGFKPVARHLADAHNGASRDRSAFDLEVAAAEADGGESEAFAALAQGGDLRFKFLRAVGRQPGGEGEDLA